MQKYPLCQVWKYPALSFRSLFLYSFFAVCLFFFSWKSMFHALPEPPALSLAAAHQKSWVLCMGASAGGTLPSTIPLCILPKFLAAHQPGKPDRKQEGDARTASLASQLHFTCTTSGCPLLQGCVSVLGHATCSKSKDRGVVIQTDTRLPSPSTPTFSAHIAGIFRAVVGVQSGHRCGGKPSGTAAAGTRCHGRPRARRPDLPQEGLEPGCGGSFPPAPRLGLELRLRMCLFKQY